MTSNLELEIYFDDYETKPRTEIVNVDSVEHAQSILKGYKGDHDYQHANLYKVSRVCVDLV